MRKKNAGVIIALLVGMGLILFGYISDFIEYASAETEETAGAIINEIMDIA